MTEPAPKQQGLSHPGPILVLTLTTDASGHSDINYVCTPEAAVVTLRTVADALEEKIAQQRLDDAIETEAGP